MLFQKHICREFGNVASSISGAQIVALIGNTHRGNKINNSTLIILLSHNGSKSNNLKICDVQIRLLGLMDFWKKENT